MPPKVLAKAKAKAKARQVRWVAAQVSPQAMDTTLDLPFGQQRVVCDVAAVGAMMGANNPEFIHGEIRLLPPAVKGMGKGLPPIPGNWVVRTDAELREAPGGVVGPAFMGGPSQIESAVTADTVQLLMT